MLTHTHTHTHKKPERRALFSLQGGEGREKGTSLDVHLTSLKERTKQSKKARKKKERCKGVRGCGQGVR